MKRKLSSLIILGLFITLDATLITTALGAGRKNGYNYSFIMNNSVVDGNQTGQYFHLDQGNVYISGVHRITSTDDWGVNNGYNSVHYTLYMSRFGFDKKIGSIEAAQDPNSQWHYTTAGPEGTLGYAEKSSSKYYLYIYKLDDGHNISGEGTVYQQ